MSGLTIRARLALAILVLTGLILGVGLWLGMGLLDRQLRDAAIDDRVEVFDTFEIELGDFRGEVLFDLSDFEGFFSEAISSELFGIEVEGRDFDAALARSVVEEIGVSDALIDEYGTSTGDLYVLLVSDRIARISVDRSTEIVESVEEGVVVVPIADLFELDFLRFDQFGEEQPDDLTLAFGRRQIDGTTVGFVAEVGEGLEALDQVRNTMFVAVVVLTLLSGVATWVIAGRALRPVGAITAQVREISSGTLRDRVPEPSGADEIGLLARTMNTMLGRLETSDLRRRQFVSDASHELRTPVAVLRSEAEVARRAPETTTIDDFAEVVLKESGRLERLVEDLLTLARGDETRILDSSSTIDVDELVLEEAARTRALPVDRRSVSAGRVVGHGDEMMRVIAHLLDNAARHGRSTIAVGVQTLGPTVQIWVDDDGPGISEEQRERIFERFIRLDDARTRDSGGAGLGLAVVHSTVAHMGGTIKVFDSPFGGARFQIELPAA